MTYTVIKSSNTVTTTPLLPTSIPELLPGVSVGGYFNTTLTAGNSATPSQTEISGSYARTLSGVTIGGPTATILRPAPIRPPITLNQPTIVIFKQITNLEWVKNLGPNGNGVARNELGDWFTESALSASDQFGNGIKLETIAATGTVSETVTASDGTTASGVTYSGFPTLKISGSYNSAVFPYNILSYTNNNSATVLTVNNLYSFPDRVDSFLGLEADTRTTTQLRFTVRVTYSLSVSWGIWNNFLSSTEKNKILALYNARGYTTSGSGTELHEVTHNVTNNLTAWGPILEDIRDTRVRTLTERDYLYQNTSIKKITIS